MKNKLPVYIENLELPSDDSNKVIERNNSYGYVSILYILSLLISLGSIITVIIFRNR